MSWIAIVNGFGLTLGDSIIGLQALHAANARDAFGRARAITFRLQPERSAAIGDLYMLAPQLAEIHPQPYHDIGLGEPERLIDIRDFAFDPSFRGVAMIDFFLGKLGLDPAAVPGALKRNVWLKPVVRYLPRSDLPPRYVLVCPHAAMALREMPDAAHETILCHLLAAQALPVLTQGVVPENLSGQAVAVPQARSLGELCALVAGAALIVSTDTAMVHLADAFDIPCVAVFTTHRPEWRVRDYPLCRPLHRAADLPPALEFARELHDVVVAQNAWGPASDWLKAAIDNAIVEFGLPR
ncbi:MAG: glycosyltransferase family 9 protein [Pseudorhodoplanes sp.]